jgi:Chitinase class I
MSDTEATTYVENERKIANLVYANRYGNGDTASGDGFAYRGGGFIQLTFKSNYVNVGSKIGVNIANSPDKICDPVVAAKSAAQFFINAYGGANKLSFGDLESALISITKKVNPSGFAHDYPIVKQASTLCIIKKDAETIANEATEKESAKPNDPENDIKRDATKEEIDSGIVGGVLIRSTSSTNTGFKDPNGRYPLGSFLKEQDTNRLSRRNTDQTVVRSKAKNRRTEIRSIGSTFSEPAPAFNGQYPFNHVFASESGHLQEFDDTPGSERTHLYHTSGTYQEVDKFGNKTNKIIGDNFTIIERNGYVYVDGTLRMSVNSDVKIVIAGNLAIEVDGDINYDVGGNVTWKVGGSNKYGVGGQHSISASGSFDVDSSKINLNSGTSDPIGSSARSGSSNDYGLQIPENFLGADSLNIDDASEEDVNAFHKKLIASGDMTQKQLDDGNAVTTSAPPADTNQPENSILPIPASCVAFSGKTGIPATTQLSTKFTLGMLSSNAVVTHAKVVAQMGLTESELVCNLKNLAENCLDKIKIKYPTMVVTSAFREMGTNKTSQHPLGMAADMQFTGVAKSEYYDIAIWIRDNVLYDQLILEFKTYGTGNPWIHISFNNGGNRKQVLTFMNDKLVSQGLRKLG